MKKPVRVAGIRIYRAILVLLARLGKRPTQQQIAEEAGYKSKGSASKYIKELEEAGWIERDYFGAIRYGPRDAHRVRNSVRVGPICAALGWLLARGQAAERCADEELGLPTDLSLTLR